MRLISVSIGDDMIRRLKGCLLVGFVLSFSLHIASAAMVAFFPFRDEPMSPQPIFIYSLLPGWIVSGGPTYPVQLWRETFAAGLNGVFYGLIVFGLLAIWNRWREATGMSD
jgi:hypothetical protein